MRVVVDTNVLVSFAIRQSRNFKKIFDHIAGHGVTLISEDTLAELSTVLHRKKFRKYFAETDIPDYIEWYANISEIVAVKKNVAACSDPNDDKFLSLAVAGKADCIIAEDRDLVDMVTYENIPIYRPAEFIKRFIE